jgi:hypothetical protein
MRTTTVYLTASQVTQAVTDIRKAYARLRYFDTHPAYRNGAARERDVTFYDAQVSVNETLLINGGHKKLVGNLVQEHVLQTRVNEAKRGIVQPGVVARPELQARLRNERKAIRETLASLPDDDAPCVCGDYDHDTAHHTEEPTLTVTSEAQAVIDGWAAELTDGYIAHIEAHDGDVLGPQEDGTAVVRYFTIYLGRRLGDFSELSDKVRQAQRYIYDTHTRVAEFHFGLDSLGQEIAGLVYKTVGRDIDQVQYLQQYQADRLASGMLGAVIDHASQEVAVAYLAERFQANGGSPTAALRAYDGARVFAVCTGSVGATERHSKANSPEIVGAWFRR